MEFWQDCKRVSSDWSWFYPVWMSLNVLDQLCSAFFVWLIWSFHSFLIRRCLFGKAFHQLLRSTSQDILRHLCPGQPLHQLYSSHHLEDTTYGKMRSEAEGPDYHCYLYSLNLSCQIHREICSGWFLISLTFRSDWWMRIYDLQRESSQLRSRQDLSFAAAEKLYEVTLDGILICLIALLTLT